MPQGAPVAHWNLKQHHIVSHSKQQGLCEDGSSHAKTFVEQIVLNQELALAAGGKLIRLDGSIPTIVSTLRRCERFDLPKVVVFIQRE